MAGFIHFALLIAWHRRLFVSSSLWSCFRSPGSKVSGILGTTRLYCLSLMCEPSMNTLVKVNSMSTSVIHFVASLLLRVRRIAPFLILCADSTFASWGFAASSMVSMASFAFAMISLRLFMSKARPSSLYTWMRICLALRSMSPMTLGSVLALLGCIGSTQRTSLYDNVMVAILTVVSVTLLTLVAIASTTFITFLEVLKAPSTFVRVAVVVIWMLVKHFSMALYICRRSALKKSCRLLSFSCSSFSTAALVSLLSSCLTNMRSSSRRFFILLSILSLVMISLRTFT